MKNWRPYVEPASAADKNTMSNKSTISLPVAFQAECDHLINTCCFNCLKILGTGFVQEIKISLWVEGLNKSPDLFESWYK